MGVREYDINEHRPFSAASWPGEESSMTPFQIALTDEIVKTAAGMSGLKAAIKRVGEGSKKARSQAARGAGLKHVIEKQGTESGNMPGYEGSGGTAYHAGRWGGHPFIDRKATDRSLPIYKKEAATAVSEAAGRHLKEVIQEAEKGKQRHPTHQVQIGTDDPRYGGGIGNLGGKKAPKFTNKMNPTDTPQAFGTGSGATHLFMQD